MNLHEFIDMYHAIHIIINAWLLLLDELCKRVHIYARLVVSVLVLATQ